MQEKGSEIPFATKEGNKSMLLKILGVTLGAIFVLKFANLISSADIIKKPPPIKMN